MLSPRSRFLRPLLLASLAAPMLTIAGCNNAVVVQLMSGPQTFEVSTSSVEVPAELQTDARIAEVPCPMGMCPSNDTLPLACMDGLCDPEPRTISAPVGDVVDFDVLLREASTILRFVDAIEVTRVQYRASPNSLNVDIPDIEIFWGPETAAGIDAPGVARLGVIPGLPAGTAQEGDMNIDAEGSARLSDHIVGVSRRVRFFARTSIDLEPGDPVPSGGATVTVNLTVRAIGRILD
ncbi:MAG: hypothetical protein J0L92_05495 [Deltaproteobacteria bacterium]|nr:hypothetical protein [Deltaproteobacteria bacterium]